MFGVCQRRGLIRKGFVWALILSVQVFCGPSAQAQSGRRLEPAAESEGQNTGAAEDEEVLRIRTEEVLLPVSVRDGVGAPVSGLGPDSFFVYDNGVRQEINSFNRERIPANIVLLLDASGSVFSKMRLIREAAKRFIQGLQAEDKVCVMQFADKVELLQDWTGAGEQKPLLKSLDWRYHAGLSTAFYDGLYLAAQEQLSKVEGRRLIILLTDGIDTTERQRASYADALGAVRRQGVSVYVVSLTASLRALLEEQTCGGKWARILACGYDQREVSRSLNIIEGAEKLLTGLALQTGGRIFLPIKEDELGPAYSAIAEELRTQYIITYRPHPRSGAGTWRRVRVLVSPGGYEVASREGYTVQ
jgi:Ca-activated chloride channel family protein